MYNLVMNPEFYKKAVSQNLKRIRESKGLSTSIIAEILGVSQAKFSYIEHCKGILSAADVAILSRKLNVPITDFFSGINDEDKSERQDLIQQLARFGAVLLAAPKGIIVDAIPFEDVFVLALGFLEDERLHQGFLTALITQAGEQEIIVDQIYAHIGSSPFLITRALKEARLALEIIQRLPENKNFYKLRVVKQIEKISKVAESTLKSAGWKDFESGLIHFGEDQLTGFVEFVTECLYAKK